MKGGCSMIFWMGMDILFENPELMEASDESKD